jgi:hypothetical protein
MNAAGYAIFNFKRPEPIERPQKPLQISLLILYTSKSKVHYHPPQTHDILGNAINNFFLVR